jgi:hypothetical protein
VHIHNLPITSLPAHNSCHNDQLVLKDKIPYTSLVVPAAGVQVEFQGGGELDKEQEQKTEECPRA